MIIKGLKSLFFTNLANILTTLRLISSVWLILLVASNNQLFLIFTLVILCMITDIFDGRVARWCCIESRFGSFLDRMVDKIFICPLLAILSWNYWFSEGIVAEIKIFTVALVTVLVLLEILLIISGIFGLIKRLDIASNNWGKAKMVFESSVVFLWVLSLLFERYLNTKILFFSIYLIDVMLVAAIYLAVKSIEGYYQKWQ